MISIEKINFINALLNLDLDDPQHLGDFIQYFGELNNEEREFLFNKPERYFEIKHLIQKLYPSHFKMRTLN